MMSDKDELEMILRLIAKQGLPLSPILEYAIKERLEQCVEGTNDNLSKGLPSTDMDMPFVDYEKMFTNLNVNVSEGKVAPNKAILLLAIIKLLEDEELIENCIVPDKTLAKAFDEQWQYYFKNRKTPSIWTPYYRMRTEPFWHFKPNGGNELISEINREPDKMTIGKLRSLIKYAYIDKSLWGYMQEDLSRCQLRELLINKYIKQFY